MKLEEATVLIVDDEADLRDIFGGWLGRKGCTVVTAANGAEGLNILTTRKIDVLVSDIRMPVLDGVGLVRRIYEMDMLVPSIIFVSGFGDVEPREMYTFGVERLLEKPLSRKDLLRALEESLMEREELWLVPPESPMEESVALELPSLGASGACDFQLGRGGCCFAGSAMLEEGQTIDLTVSFAAEALTLRAIGVVRWYAAACGRAGMAFQYLYPDCRAWAIEAMKAENVLSFIPRCPDGSPTVPRIAGNSDYITEGASMPR